MARALAVLAAGGALTLVAFAFDAAPLFVPGVALMLGVLASIAWVTAAARGARVERRGLPSRVIEGEAVQAGMSLRRGPAGLPGAMVLDPAGELLADPRRGLHPVAPPTLVLSDALGLLSVSRRGEGETSQLLVLPRTEPIRWSASGDGRLGDGRLPRARPEPFAAVDVDGLRPYRPGTPASRIHWPALARGAGLLERRLEADGEQLPLVVLDARGELAPEQLDAAVRAAASLMLALALAGGCRALLPGERRPVVLAPDLISWHTVHARLALVQGGKDAPAPALGAQHAAGGLIYVAAGAATLPRSARGYVSVVPAPLAPSGADPSFEVAGCLGFAAGARAPRQAA